MRKETIVVMKKILQGKRSFKHYYETYQGSGESNPNCYGWPLTNLFPKSKSGTKFKVILEIVK